MLHSCRYTPDLPDVHRTEQFVERSGNSLSPGTNLKSAMANPERQLIVEA